MSDDTFLPTMIGILERLHEKSSERGAGMLSFLLDLAKTEAQDELKTAREEAQLRAALRSPRTASSWH